MRKEFVYTSEMYKSRGKINWGWQDESAIILKEKKEVEWHLSTSFASCVVDRLLYLFDLCYGSLNIDCSLPFTLFCLSSGYDGEWRSIYRTLQRQTLATDFNSHWSLTLSLFLFLCLSVFLHLIFYILFELLSVRNLGQ